MRNKLFKNVTKNDVYFWGGLGCLFAGIGLACFATLKADKEFKNAAIKLDTIKAEADSEDHPEVTTEVAKKQRVKTITITGAKVIGWFIPSAVAVGVGVYGVTKSRMELKEENKELQVLAVGLAETLRGYRDNVIAKYGEEEDFNLMHDIKKEEIVETFINEDGTTEDKVTTYSVAGENDVDNPYICYFKADNPQWNYYTDEQTEFTFKCRLMALKRAFKEDGELSLNTARKAFGFKRCAAGLITGWFNDPDDPTIDNDVTITWHKVYLRNQAGEIEPAWAIEFHCDGSIYEKMLDRDLEISKTDEKMYIEEVER